MTGKRNVMMMFNKEDLQLNMGSESWCAVFVIQVHQRGGMANKLRMPSTQSITIIK
jgi:hypothetical protein